MKKEAKLLRTKAVNSLILSIEHFNRTSDRGRIEAVLIPLDHSFEMLLKAAILHRGGKIRERRAKQTIGFDECLRRAVSDGKIQFLTPEQALTLQAINSLRDAAQHHLLDISEQHLYMQAQSGLTLFRDIYKKVFSVELNTELPTRVLPLSTSPPTELGTLFDNEVKEVTRLLRPGSRRRIEAIAKLRSLAIVEGAFQGEKLQPGESDLQKLAREVKGGKSWEEMFPGVAALDLTSHGHGPAIDLRITKKDGTPVTIVPEGTPGASVVAIKRVDELGFYNLGPTQLAEHLKLTPPKCWALMRYLDLRSDPECFKEFVIGKTRHARYSQKALTRMTDALKEISIEEIWKSHGSHLQKKPRRK
ncbi:MAG: hypothetical protein LAP61_17335 [Acidobacteriia bacterium]|nr:hypothetical protein [Terriglobia bacterium]